MSISYEERVINLHLNTDKYIQIQILLHVCYTQTQRHAHMHQTLKKIPDSIRMRLCACAQPDKRVHIYIYICVCVFMYVREGIDRDKELKHKITRKPSSVSPRILTALHVACLSAFD